MMITTILFIISAVCVINYFIKILSVLVGNSMSVPMPIPYTDAITYDNSYIYSPALGYQVYFWATYGGII